MLLWAILSKTRVNDMPPPLQASLLARCCRRLTRSTASTSAFRSIMTRHLRIAAPVPQRHEPDPPGARDRIRLCATNSLGATPITIRSRRSPCSGVPPAQTRNTIRSAASGRLPRAAVFHPLLPGLIRQHEGPDPSSGAGPRRARSTQSSSCRSRIREAASRPLSTTLSRRGNTRRTSASRPMRSRPFASPGRGSGCAPEVLDISRIAATPSTSRGRVAAASWSMLVVGARDALSFVSGTPLEARQDFRAWA